MFSMPWGWGAQADDRLTRCDVCVCVCVCVCVRERTEWGCVRVPGGRAGGRGV